ncbi:hypothetical protein ACFGVR_21630 [Mucilaginibacter sp. AW1-3]
MKVLLDIQDDKAPALLEVLKGLSYVKTEKINDNNVNILKGLKEAVEDVKLIKAGKLKGKLAKDLLNEL